MKIDKCLAKLRGKKTEREREKDRKGMDVS